MPRLGAIFPSRFFKDSDLEQPLLLTIKNVHLEEVGRGSEAEMKAILSFDEHTKELTLNRTNAKKLKKITGSDNTDVWPGTKIVVYWDETIEFGGEEVGGVRVRAPKARPAVEMEPVVPAAPAPAVKKDDDGSLPF